MSLSVSVLGLVLCAEACGAEVPSWRFRTEEALTLDATAKLRLARDGALQGRKIPSRISETANRRPTYGLKYQYLS
jgi:hypothetical protein